MVITLNENSSSIKHLCKYSKRMAKVISMVGPISYEPHTEDPYSFMVHEIIEQMLSIKAGAQIFQRLIDLCEGSLTLEKVSTLSTEQIRSIGTSMPKAMYIKGLTSSVLNGELNFTSLESMSDAEVVKKLTSIKGIGKWTANMYLIFVLDRQDILPTEDVAFLQGYKWLFKTSNNSPEYVRQKCKSWKPYSSIAARYLYHALDSGLTKNEFHLYK